MPASSATRTAPENEFRRHWRALVGSMMAASVGVIGLNAYTGGAFVPELVAKVGYTREQLSFATLLLSATVVPLALLGVGTTPPTYARVVAARFDRRRGLALGLMIAGLGVTAITAPMVMTRVIAAVG